MPHTIVLRDAIPCVRPCPDYAAGAIGGVAGGLALAALFLAQTTFVPGLGLWAAPKMAYSLLAGPEAVRPGFEAGPVLLGLAIHMALSMIYGLAFAWLAAEVPMDIGAMGALFGFSLYALNVVILPALAVHRLGHFFPPTAALQACALVGHLVFGLVLAACYRVFRRLPEM
jgi:hypothetical protein